MSSTTSGAAAPDGEPAPPKKRSFFKKAAWQKEAKPEGQEKKDMFSHANEFDDIFAEEVKRKKAEKTKLKLAEEKRILKQKREQEKWNLVHEEEKKRQRIADEGRKKRRRIESEEPGLDGLSSPVSPLPTMSSPQQDTLSSRYETLTGSLHSISSPHGKSPVVVDLGSEGDTNTDHSDTEFVVKPSRMRTVPRLESKSLPTAADSTADNGSDSDVEVVDSRTADLQARIRARVAMNARNGQKTEQPGHIVQLFIDTKIPNTNPLLVKVRSNSTLEKIRQAWCGKQGYTPAQTRDVFLTWKRNRLFDSTKIERCGISTDAQGCVMVEGSTDIYTDEDPPRVHLEAWTETTFREFKNAKVVEEEAQKKVNESVADSDDEPVPESSTEQKKFRLLLKAKGKEEFRISVKPDTTFEHLTLAYRTRFGIPDTQPITLMFDGDRLRPMDTIESADIDDMDSLEVNFK